MSWRRMFTRDVSHVSSVVGDVASAFLWGCWCGIVHAISDDDGHVDDRPFVIG